MSVIATISICYCFPCKSVQAECSHKYPHSKIPKHFNKTKSLGQLNKLPFYPIIYFSFSLSSFCRNNSQNDFSLPLVKGRKEPICLIIANRSFLSAFSYRASICAWWLSRNACFASRHCCVKLFIFLVPFFRDWMRGFPSFAV